MRLAWIALVPWMVLGCETLSGQNKDVGKLQLDIDCERNRMLMDLDLDRGDEQETMKINPPL